MDVKHADRDNLRTLTAMIDTPVQRAESALGALTETVVLNDRSLTVTAAVYLTCCW
jgi:hypothetical protein